MVNSVWLPTTRSGRVGVVAILVLLIWSVFTGLSGSAQAGQFAGMNLDGGEEPVSIGDVATGFVASSAIQTVLDIPDSRLQRRGLLSERDLSGISANIRVPDDVSHWWTRIALGNDSEYSQWRLMLEDSNPLKFEVLVLSSAPSRPEARSEIRVHQWKAIGQQRDIRAGQVGQSLTIDLVPGKRHELYVLVAGNAGRGEGLTLQAEPWFRVAQRESLAYYALTSGMIIILGVALFIGWTVLRRSVMFYSAVYGAGFLSAWAAWYGMPFTSLEFPGSVYGLHWHYAFGKLGLLVSAVSALMLVRRFLTLDKHYPFLARTIIPLAGFVSVVGVSLAIVPVSIEFLMNAVLLPVLFVATLLSLQAAVTGVPQGRWLLAGFIPVSVTTSLFALAHSGLLPLHWFTPLEVSMAVCLQIVLLIPAMAFRLRGLIRHYAGQADQARHDRNVMENKLTALSSQVVASDRHSEEMDLQWERAVTDPLTGAKNTVAFELELQKIARAIRDGTLEDMSVIMINLDGIKPLNALRGKREGDSYIARFASMLIDVLLGKARLYRLGGDEFALLPMFDANLGEVEDLIQQAVQTTKEELVRQGYVMAQASIGVARFSDGDNQPHKVSRMADEAVWRMKRSAEENNTILNDPAIAALGEKAS